MKPLSGRKVPFREQASPTNVRGLSWFCCHMDGFFFLIFENGQEIFFFETARTNIRTKILSQGLARSEVRTHIRYSALVQRQLLDQGAKISSFERSNGIEPV